MSRVISFSFPEFPPALCKAVIILKAGIEAIIEDEVTRRFNAEQLATWNMLTRTRVSFYHAAKYVGRTGLFSRISSPSTDLPS